MNYSELTEYLDSSDIFYEKNVSMQSLTSFRIGGPADLTVHPGSEEEFASVLRKLKLSDVKYCVIGRGSNVLFSDKGYSGVIVLTDRLQKTEVHGNMITVYAGVPLMSVCNTAMNNGLKGLEFAYGIPGSLGGALYMNAGAYDGCMADAVDTVRVIDIENDKILTLSNKDMNFGYRHSVLMEKPYCAVCSRLRLADDSKENIKSKMDELMSRRREKQPLEYPSAGSVFKRPEGYFAAKLIEDSGLKGYKLGGAEVSQKHAGFIVNKENATADDVMKLIEVIKNKVLKDFGVELECEIRFME